MVRHCSVSGCNVKEKQGLMLFRFPKEPERRAKWISLVNRPNWQPHANSTICEIHFGKDQWEQRRVDGSRKLQCSAIPSLLSSGVNSSPSPYIPSIDEHNYCRLSSARAIISHPPILLPQSQSLSKDVFNTNLNNTSIRPATFVNSVNLAKKISVSETQSSTSSPITDTTEEESVQVLKRRLELTEKELAALKTKHVSMQKIAGRIFNNMKKQHDRMKTEIRRLRDFHRHSHELFVKLRQDQLKALCSKTTRGRKWSTPTITEGLVYKMKWGTQDYSNFVRKFPIFPSVRTLQKAVDHVNFE